MKRMLLRLMAVSLCSTMLAQEQQIDQSSNSVYQELKALPKKQESFDQKLSAFEKAVEYLKGARDCLSGIGCTKRQSYLANYLLGAAYGFARGVAFKAIELKNPGQWLDQKDPWTGRTTKTGLLTKLSYLQLLVNELGYRYLVKEKVYPFRCLTFRGCTDQTKRYAFYSLGIWSGHFGAGLSYLGLKGAREKWQERYIVVESDEAKKALNLDPQKTQFLWYEILGFDKEPKLNDAKREYRQRSRKYHPDKARGDEKRALHQEIQQALNAAQEKGNLKW